MVRCPETCSSVAAMPTARGAKGRDAELAAHRYLLQHGYQPVARNVRTRFGEIDIVAKDGPVLVFIEVKSRSGPNALTSAAEAVGARKQSRLRALAAWYLREHGYSAYALCRFDVVVVDLSPWGPVATTLVRDAF